MPQLALPPCFTYLATGRQTINPPSREGQPARLIYTPISARKCGLSPIRVFKSSKGRRHGLAYARAGAGIDGAQHRKLPSRVPVLGYDPLGRIAGNEASGDLRPLYPRKRTFARQSKKVCL